MKSLKLYFALGVSLLINLSIFYALESKSKKWELSSSQLKTGANTSTLIENINLVEASVAKQVMQTQKNVQNELVKLKGNKAKTKIQAQVQKQTQEKMQSKATVTANSAPSGGAASPQIVQKAQLKSTPGPLVYPPQAIKDNATGKVGLKAIIRSDGRISNIEVAQSSGSQALDEAAIKWFSELNFEPANDGVTSINSVVTQTITFDLHEAVG